MVTSSAATGTPAPGCSGHVLLITPQLFGYHCAIERELQAMGYMTTWWDDRAGSGSLTKLALRLWPRWTSHLLTSRFKRQIEAARALPVSHVLVVKGEGLSVEVVTALRRQWPEARLSLYLWDSIDNTRGARLIAPLFDRVASFDPVDAAHEGWVYRPLFAREEALRSSNATSSPLYDWSFVGTLHSDRHRILRRLRRSNVTARPFVFGYLPGRLVKTLRLLTDWSLWTAPEGTVSTRPLPADRVSQISAQSRAIIDIEHPQQRGLTMRTIETLLADRKLATTNAYLRQTDLFDETRAHVLDRRRPHLPTTFLESAFEPIPQEVRRKYLLRGWIDDLLHEG